MKSILLLLLLVVDLAIPARAQQTQSIYYTASTSADGQSNITLGAYAGTSGGLHTVTLGAFAGQLNRGNANVFVGYAAGTLTAFGSYNAFIGDHAGYANSSGTLNSFLGFSAGYNNTTGGNNSFLGSYAGVNNTTGSYNSFVGASSGSYNTTGDQNSFLGYNTGTYNTSGSNNAFVGYAAGFQNTTATANVFVGAQAGYSNTTASNNVFIGYQAGYANTTGIANLFMGNAAGTQSNGSYNLFIGNGSGYNNTSGLGNTFIGDGSGLGNVTGSNNVYIGRSASLASNAAGNNNTFIGFQARTGGPTVDNSTAIGVNALVTASNSVVIGAPGAKVGIGNSAPQNKLEITQGIANQSGLRLTNLTSNSPASVTNQYKFLTVNSAGDVILGSVNGSAREGVSESLWQQKGDFLQNSKGDAVIIGGNVARTPSGYKLFVEDGILTEKVKVAVKNTSEWSDYVFKPNYSLKPLIEVEQYIQKNEHLPGIPSAEEVVEKGIDVAKMDAKLLEKIEELTLYSIQQDRTIQTQQQEIEAVKQKQAELERLVNQLLKQK
ncbi:hypothetical protein GCM10027592_60780 [Spirosoma flavus]